MRRLLAASGSRALTVGVVALLIAGGGYALATAGSKTITACVHQHGGALYVAKKCAKHDTKLSWSKVGPRGPAGTKGNTGGQGLPGKPGAQGPGATTLVFDATGTASPTATAIGAMGPFALTGTCVQSGATTSLTVNISGPGRQQDGFILSGGPVTPFSLAFPPVSNSDFDTSSSSTTTARTIEVQATFIPTSGQSVQVLQTTSVTGSTTNTCHFSMSITPSSTTTVSHGSDAPGAAAVRGVAPRRRPGRITMFGVPIV